MPITKIPSWYCPPITPMKAHKTVERETKIQDSQQIKLSSKEIAKAIKTNYRSLASWSSASWGQAQHVASEVKVTFETISQQHFKLADSALAHPVKDVEAAEMGSDLGLWLAKKHVEQGNKFARSAQYYTQFANVTKRGLFAFDVAGKLYEVSRADRSNRFDTAVKKTAELAGEIIGASISESMMRSSFTTFSRAMLFTPIIMIAAAATGGYLATKMVEEIKKNSKKY